MSDPLANALQGLLDVLQGSEVIHSERCCCDICEALRTAVRVLREAEGNKHD